MATYREIILYIQTKYGYTPQTSYIADAKTRFNLEKRRVAPNRKSAKIVNRCPKKKVAHIEDAFRRFGMIA